MRDNLSHQTIQTVRDNPSHLTNIHLIDRSWGQIYREENSYLKQKYNQQTAAARSHGGDEQHNTEVDRRMHNGYAKSGDLVGEHVQTKEKLKMGKEW
jgi:hypothetical protein